jgi:hypothetical protein
MRRRLAIIAIAVLAVAGIGLTIWLFVRPTYDDTVKSCQKALAAQMQADGRGKPSACRDLSEDDYSAVLMNQIMDDEGWLDEDGHFDERKMLEDSLDN